MKSKFQKSRYLYVVTGTLIAVGLLIMLGFVRISRDLESNQIMVLTFRNFQQLNHNLNENMLRSRAFMLENYDPLVANVGQVKNLCLAIEAPDSSFMTSKSEEIIEATESYCLIVGDTVELIEKFKSKNSILRNSIQYLPTLLTQLEGSPVEAKAESLLNDTLRYTANPTDELALSIAAKKKAKVFFTSQAARYKEPLQGLFFHVDLAVQSAQELNKIETEILSTKVDKALSAFETIYNRWHEAKEKQLNFYYIGLWIVCILMGVGIYMTVRKLQSTLSQLNDFNENLEQKVESRTVELSQALNELEQKQHMLLQSTKMSALGEMAGGIAHEINTPLGAILLNAEMLQGTVNEGGDPDMLPGIEAIIKTVERISKIIVGLRRFSRDSSSDDKNPTLVAQIIEDTLTLCNEKIKANSVDLRLNYKARDFRTPCIPEQISQVILNLLSNSVDAISDQARDQRWIQIDVADVDARIEISVTDSGHGIPVAIQDKLMQPFFTTKQVGQGTGLGLSISRSIIESHAGKFFYDKNSANTRFVIQLPQTNNEPVAA